MGLKLFDAGVAETIHSLKKGIIMNKSLFKIFAEFILAVRLNCDVNRTSAASGIEVNNSMRYIILFS
jgi:hypothetical protein